MMFMVGIFIGYFLAYFWIIQRSHNNDIKAEYLHYLLRKMENEEFLKFRVCEQAKWINRHYDLLNDNRVIEETRS